ncbi:MAG: TetR/AcrR family transcriptional regulator [Clostridiales bacterium]|nr:TetR/AcrR family transcriptional regulator [Clostridiales bacterium]
MARKVTITKELILDTALAMLIRDGYSSVNVKTLAKEIGCSTQPIVWHFENMEGLRMALSEYARDYAAKKAVTDMKDKIEGFEYLGRSYVRMAIKEPNLFRFLYLGESPMGKPYDLKAIARDKKNKPMISAISFQTGLNEEQVIRFIRNTVIYSHGIATMVATGVFKGSEKEMMAMINDAADSFIAMEGIDPEKISGKEKKR